MIITEIPKSQQQDLDINKSQYLITILTSNDLDKFTIQN